MNQLPPEIHRAIARYLTHQDFNRYCEAMKPFQSTLETDPMLRAAVQINTFSKAALIATLLLEESLSTQMTVGLVRYGMHIEDLNAFAIIWAIRTKQSMVVRLLLQAQTRPWRDIHMLCSVAAETGDLDILKLIFNAAGIAEPEQYTEYLPLAVQSGNMDCVTWLLERDADPNYNDGEPLIEAAVNGKNEIARLLIHKGADLHVREDYALRFSAGRGFIDMVKLLIEEGADVEAQENNALLVASTNGSAELVEVLLDNGADVHAHQDASLVWAAHREHFETVRVLLQYGADAHAQNDDAIFWPALNKDETSVLELFSTSTEEKIELSLSDQLICAARRGQLDKMRTLMDQGADVHHREDQAFIVAVKYGHVEIVSLLLDQLPNMDIHGHTAIIIAIDMGHLDVLKLVVERGADLHSREEYALLLAAKNGQLDMVQYMLDQDCDIHARDEAALITAVDYGHLEVARFLIKQGGHVRARNNCALRLAAGKGFNEIVELLLDHGADLNDCDDLFTEDALTLATIHGHKGTAELLVSRGAEYQYERILKSVVRLQYDAEIFEAIMRHLDFSKFLGQETYKEYLKKALFNACSQGITRSIRFILAESHFEPVDLLNAIDIATENEDVEVIKLLLQQMANR